MIARFRNIHGDRYDYTSTIFVNTRTKVDIRCRIHGVFSQSPRRHILGDGCPTCYFESRKKPVYGVGINDLKNGTLERCYLTWYNILTRCYDPVTQSKEPTYKGCSICDEWKILSNFKAWFENPSNGYQDGYALDKDILVKGNKIYSPDTYCFVPQSINSVFTNRIRFRGAYPLGVTLSNGRYRASLVYDGKRHHLGFYSTPEAAFLAYKKAKEQYVKDLAEKYYKEGKITERVYRALLAYRVEITD